MRYHLTFSADENTNTVILNDTTSNENKIVGYISVFRDYRIQISMTSDGVGDLGSSRVLPYLSDIVKNMGVEVARAFIQGLILEALVNYQRSRYFDESTNHLGAAILPKMEDIRQLDLIATRFLSELVGNQIEPYYC